MSALRPTLASVLEVIARALSSPRDRLGRLDVCTDEAREAREELRLLAVHYDIARHGELMRDSIDQCARVARAVLDEAKEAARQGGRASGARKARDPAHYARLAAAKRERAATSKARAKRPYRAS